MSRDSLTGPVPENIPARLEALEAAVTPTEEHYRRNHYAYPRLNPGTWRLEVTGAVERPLSLSLADLQALAQRELTVLLECAGHRRMEFTPQVSGVPWREGAVSQARWGGAALAEVLRQAGLKPDALEVVLHSADSGDFKGVEGVHTFSRSLPLDKALHPDTLLALRMNGEPLPVEHGAPLRSIVPGWYSMDCVKWIVAIEVVTEPFRGPYQELDYRFQPADEPGIGTRLTAIPVSSLILSPAPEQAATGDGEIHGIAWGGSGGIATVEVRVDDGPWQPARLGKAAGPYEWVTWTAGYATPSGAHVVASRATDGTGVSQPEHATWNKRGYVNNSVHRVRVNG